MVAGRDRAYLAGVTVAGSGTFMTIEPAGATSMRLNSLVTTFVTLRAARAVASLLNSTSWI